MHRQPNLNDTVLFYLCPDTFDTCDEPKVNVHGRAYIPVYAFYLEDERGKPACDAQGALHSRAPLWYLEALHLHYTHED